MSAKRGDRVAPPAVDDEWEIRFATSEAAKGWEELCRQAAQNTAAAWRQMRNGPAPHPETRRHHRLKGALASGVHRGRTLPQWQIEVTANGRVWYLLDEADHILWLRAAGTRHAKVTE